MMFTVSEPNSFWKRTWKFRRELIQGFFAEICGVFILVTIGNSSIAQSVLSQSDSGGFISINFAYGLGLAIALYFTGNVSGGHLNPAVTIAFALFHKFSWVKVPFYILAQLIGGYLSGVCVFLVYFDALTEFDGGTRQVLGGQGTGGIFATYPKEFLSNGNGVIDQVVSTALLVSVIFLMDSKIKRNEISSAFAPMIIGMTVLIIGLSFGFNCGYAINPARDFGPRCFIASAGWGIHAFTEPNATWWLVPFFSPVLGAILGGGLFQFCNYMIDMGTENSDTLMAKAKADANGHGVCHQSTLDTFGTSDISVSADTVSTLTSRNGGSNVQNV